MKRHPFAPRTITLIFLWNIRTLGRGCTNFLVTPGASTDGSSFIAYDADSVTFMGNLYHYPPTGSKEIASSRVVMDGSEDGRSEEYVDIVKMRKVWDWDSGRYLGTIPEASTTNNVVGNCNEYGLCIGETTFGGIRALSNQNNATIDYGSLIYITLQRSKTAREAIHTMATLTDTYGYASSGESFSIADKSGDVWIMEVIGRGIDKVGAVWVALRIPDGYIGAHANQARITTFPREDPENCLYAPDVVDVARDLDLYHGTDEDFSFSDTYDPVTFEGARFCDARVWSIYSTFAEEDMHFRDRYASYAKGENLTNRMPLFIKPKGKISLEDVMAQMRDHYEGTALEFSDDAGAGPSDSPYRPLPLEWNYEGKHYFNERSISIASTGWALVAQIRPWMTENLSALLWFAADDSSTSPHVPVYAASRELSASYGGTGPQDGHPDRMLEFDFGKAFWVQNMVSNLAYSRWDRISPYLTAKLLAVHRRWVDAVNVADARAQTKWEEDGPDAAIEFVTSFSVAAGDSMHVEWLKFYGEMFARFRDAVVVEEDSSDRSCGCKATETGIEEEWKERIVKETGSHYEVPSYGIETVTADDKESLELKPIRKAELKGLH